MCCYSSKLGVKELRKMMKENGGTMTFWKVIRSFIKLDYSTEYTSIHNSHFWREGVHSCPEALSQKDSGYYPELEINEGFHVYLDKNRAMQVRAREYCGSAVVLLEVTCNVKDLIGAEEYTPDNLYHHTAVFSKVTVTKDQWKKFQRRHRDARRRDTTYKQ